jgi:hypothetical protein
MKIIREGGLKLCMIGASGSVGIGICKELASFTGIKTFAVSRAISTQLDSLASERLLPVELETFLQNINDFDFDVVLNLAFSGCHTKDNPDLFLTNIEKNVVYLQTLYSIVKSASSGLCIHLGSELESCLKTRTNASTAPALNDDDTLHNRARRLYAVQKRIQSKIISEFSTLDSSIYSIILFAPYIVSPCNAKTSLAGMIETAIGAMNDFKPRHPEQELRYTTTFSLASQVIRLSRDHQEGLLKFPSSTKTINLYVEDVRSSTVMQFVEEYTRNLRRNWAT